jgi:hypothetical protein
MWRKRFDDAAETETDYRHGRFERKWSMPLAATKVCFLQNDALSALSCQAWDVGRATEYLFN